MATATLNDKFMAESVVVKNGANTYDFMYSDYKDWNNPLNPAEALYAGRMIEKKNGVVTRDITTTVTETAQMYVVVPVPASVKAAIKPTYQAPNWTITPNNPPPAAAAAAPTPRVASGKPDLTGSWQGAGGGQQGSGGDMFRRCTPFQTKNCMEWTNQSEDWVFMSATRLDQRQPLYKPEHWDKIIELDQWTNKEDPVRTCLPLGVPRQGPPAASG